MSISSTPHSVTQFYYDSINVKNEANVNKRPGVGAIHGVINYLNPHNITIFFFFLKKKKNMWEQPSSREPYLWYLGCCFLEKYNNKRCM